MVGDRLRRTRFLLVRDVAFAVLPGAFVKKSAALLAPDVCVDRETLQATSLRQEQLIILRRVF
jgi:hypothetical protein